MQRLVERLRRRRIAQQAERWHVRMLEPSSEAEVAAFEAWLRADPRHARAYAWADTRTLQATRLSPRLLPAPAARDVQLRPALAVALSVLVIGGALFWTAARPDPAVAAFTNPGPGIRTIVLDPATTLRLDVGASLTVDRAGGVDVRTGRVRFVATGVGRRPLSITAHGVRLRTARAIVDVRAAGETVELQLITGTAVAVSAAAHGAGAIRLAPGRVLQIERDRVTVKPPMPDAATWPDRRISLDGTPLSAIVARANRPGQPRIVVATPAIGSLRVSGVLDTRETGALARKLAATLDLRVIERGDRLVLAE